MIVIDDTSSLARIADLIARRIEELGDDAGLATFVVVEPGDPIDVLDDPLGFPVLTNRADGTRYGDPSFTPSFEVAEDHGGFFELVFVLADHGDGAI